MAKVTWSKIVQILFFFLSVTGGRGKRREKKTKMSAFGYGVAPDENIFVYRQPPRRNFLGDLGLKPRRFAPVKPLSPSRPSWTDRFRRSKVEDGDEDWTDPTYWIYLLVAFGVLTLVLLGFYYILQSARTAVARKEMQSNQERALLLRNSSGPMSLSIPNPNMSTNMLKNVLVDRVQKNPEPCRTGTCPAGVNTSNSANNNTQDVPRLTFSPSTGLVPTSPGTVIHGGFGTDICIGCKCTGCETPGRCSNGYASSSFVPYLSPKGLSAQMGSGYIRDPYSQY